MSGKIAKKIKKQVALKSYGEFAENGNFSKSDKKDIYGNEEFKTIYRAAKKNYTKGISKLDKAA